MKVNFDVVEQTQKEETARQLAAYINERLQPLVTMLPTQPEYIESYTQFIIPSSYENHFIDSRAFSLYVVSSFMLGFDWPKDPLYRYLMDIYGEISFPYDEMLNILMYQTEQDVRLRLENLPELHNKAIELLQEPTHTLTKNAFIQYWNSCYQLRNLSRPVDQQALLKTYETDLRLYMNWSEAKISKEQISYQERWTRQNMGLSIEEKTSLDFLSAQQLYALMIHCSLCLSFGRFYLINPLYQDLQQMLYFNAENLDTTKINLGQYLINHLTILERQHHG